MTRRRYRFVGRTGDGDVYLFVLLDAEARPCYRRVPIAQFWRAS